MARGRRKEESLSLGWGVLLRAAETRLEIAARRSERIQRSMKRKVYKSPQ